jgi:hypothetical protein
MQSGKRVDRICHKPWRYEVKIIDSNPSNLTNRNTNFSNDAIRLALVENASDSEKDLWRREIQADEM